MTERCCPACGNARARDVGPKNDMSLHTCLCCGTLYARHTADVDGETACDYEAYYHEANLSIPLFIEQLLDETVSEFASFRRTNRLLDLGCGAGTILRAARRAGWEAMGVEISPPAVRHIRAEGFEVFLGELAEARFPAGHFDVVTASEVLEHLPAPRPLLMEVARVLRPGGLFWGTTPHGRGLSARALGIGWSVVSPPEHLQLFSLSGLRRLLRDAGFSRVRLSARSLGYHELRNALWRRRRAQDKDAGGETNEGVITGFDRVQAAYQLNQKFTRRRAGRLAKAALNTALSAMRVGDSIKFYAIK